MSTPKGLFEECFNDTDSWEEVSREDPVIYFPGSGIENMLLDAQKEGSESSLSSHRTRSSEHDSEDGSEKEGSRTPSPTVDSHPGLNVLSTQSGVAQRTQGSTDWIWDWSSRPDIRPPKEWQLHHPIPCGSSYLSVRLRTLKELISTNEILSVILISNLMSLVVGIGVGIFFTVKRSGGLTSVSK